MPNNDTNQNMTRVDTGAMHETAAIMEKNLKAVRAAQDGLSNIGGTYIGNFPKDGGWDGSAANLYAEAMRMVTGRIITSYNAYSKLLVDLKKVTEEYERAHGIALKEAEGIEMATWAEI